MRRAFDKSLQNKMNNFEQMRTEGMCIISCLDCGCAKYVQFPIVFTIFAHFVVIICYSHQEVSWDKDLLGFGHH